MSRRLALAGVALAVLALGLPWRWVPGTSGYLTSGYYSTYCDYDGFCTSSYTPGVFVPGLPEGTYPGSHSVLRFFVVAAVLLALWGVRRADRRALGAAAALLAGGAVLSGVDRLTGGLVAVVAATVCLALAARSTAPRHPEGDGALTRT